MTVGDGYERRGRCAQWLMNALAPKVAEFKVISREPEKHEFMPIVYLIERSMAWKKRVPRAIERYVIESYVAPLLPVEGRSSSSNYSSELDGDGKPRTVTGFTKHDLDVIGQELRQRTELLAQHERVCTTEALYKFGVLVNYAPVPTLQKSELFQVVEQILTTLSRATFQRALLVPVSLHFCADGGIFNVRRYAGLRYGAPALVEARDVDIFREDPLEFVHHVSAKLAASLKMKPPQTAAQMDILRLSRSLHVYCAKVYRDDCFSRRQIASMNEEILQIHFRTRNHPDMLVLKTEMMAYCSRLAKWKLRDEDINAATVAGATPRTPIHVACVLATMLLRLAMTPWRLGVAGACDLVYRPKPSQRIAMRLAVLATIKCALACLLLGVMFRLLVLTGHHWWSMAVMALVLALHMAAPALGCEDVAAHWKKIQFYVMDPSELKELKLIRVRLARRIHGIVAQYVSTDLPPPVLQQGARGLTVTTTSTTTDSCLDEYSLNPHHKIFINAPRSFPLGVAIGMRDGSEAHRAVYAPKMLRDESWRIIYGSLAPPHLQFAALLADNKGDSLPMERLLQTQLFNAVLTAYIMHQQKRARPCGHENEDTTADVECRTSELSGERGDNDDEPVTDGSLGRFKHRRDVIDAALELAEDEELS